MPIFTGITEKVIAYLRIVNISHYINAISKSSCVRLKVQMVCNHRTTDSSSKDPRCHTCVGLL